MGSVDGTAARQARTDALSATNPVLAEFVVAVLGKAHANEARLGEDLLALFDGYHRKSDLKSKPSTHINAMAALTDQELLEDLPKVLERLVEDVRARLEALPE